MSSHKNRVKMTSATTGTGTLTLGSASSGYQSFATAYGADATVDILITEGTAWEVARDCAYTNSGTTVSRGTLEASSTGSAINFGGTQEVSVIATAEFGNSAENVMRGYIAGMGISYSSTTAFVVASGRVDINGVQRAYTGATYASGSTMSDIANSTVTLGASKCYFVFAYNNAGTVEIRIEERDGTGDGADPTWDATLDYWKSASTGAQARRIGKFWTNASSQIVKFWYVNFGRHSAISAENVVGLVLLSSGTATSYTSVTVTPYMTADDIAIKLGLQIARAPAGTADVIGQLSIDSGSTYVSAIGMSNDTSGQGYIRLRPVTIPYAGTLHYLVSGTNAAMSLILLGAEFIR